MRGDNVGLISQNWGSGSILADDVEPGIKGSTSATYRWEDSTDPYILARVTDGTTTTFAVTDTGRIEASAVALPDNDFSTIRLEGGSGTIRVTSSVSVWGDLDDNFSKVFMDESGSTIGYGAGGTDSWDTFLRRSDVSQLDLDSNGGSGGAANFRLAGNLSLGDGTGTYDIRIRRSAATTVIIDDGASGPADLKLLTTAELHLGDTVALSRPSTRILQIDDQAGAGVGVRLAVRTAAPTAPPAGFLTIYALNDGDDFPQLNVKNSDNSIFPLTFFTDGA